MQIPGVLVATVSNCEQSCSSGPPDELRDYHINMRMKDLYREGYRRFRVVPLPRTGDAIKHLVMGWPS